MRVFLVAIFAATIAYSSAFAQESNQTSSAQKVISDQISAFLEGDDARAFSHAAPSIRRFFGSAENFLNMVRGGYRPLYMPSDFRFGKSQLNEGTLFQELIATDEAGKKWQAIYSLRQQSDGSWKITGVTMNPLGGSSI